MADVISQRSETGDDIALLRVSTGEDGRLHLEIDDCGPNPARIALDLDGSKLLRAIAIAHCDNADFANGGEAAARGGYLHLREDRVNARLGAAMDRGYGNHSTAPVRRSADGDRLIDWVR